MHFIICGGGIAGLAAACALRHRDHQITILERNGTMGEIGAAIQMKPNASRWLPLLGVPLESLKGVDVRRVVQYTTKGQVMMSQPIHSEAMFGSRWILVHRSDLHSELLKSATTRGEEEGGSSPPAKVETGVKVIQVDPELGIVRSEDGRQWQGDVVIGADGIRSKVRSSILDSPVPEPTPAMQAAYRALVPTSSIRTHLPQLAEELCDPAKAGMVVWLGEDRRIVTYPCRDLEYINIVAIIPDPSLVPEAHLRPSSFSELQADFQGFPETVVKMLGLVETISIWQLRDLDCLPKWTKGKSVLIGDASHAMLPHMGQGGSTAIEDAAALRYIFSSPSSPPLPKSVETLISDFEKLRLERIHKIQEYSRVQGQPRPVESKGHTMNALQFSKFAFGHPGFDLN
ncbi:FAD/NAD(P)-binding domain-containing protein [Violaceomyces palustris]|uniref:FAD/NAD(P)-binding domain-containing protein n=1 Tax=Violaceomyces palustris TaxID=1673888 RepID=A0ACD0NM92_9BASI|nr:FAD/NAD(P)-binding domain-containing protein [Violaceomyces palustris]